MNDMQKSLASAGVVLVSIAAAIGGAVVRKSTDLGQETRPVASRPSMLASNQPQVDVPAADYFYELSDKIKTEYVEPVTDDQKLATGAVRGMIASLGDPESTFMGKDEFQAYLNARQGKYAGIGVDLALEFDAQIAKERAPAKGTEPQDSSETSAEEALAMGLQIPRVVVTDVVPGGPAAAAGVKPGDIVYSVDGHWVANGAEVEEFREKQKQFLDKKIDAKVYDALRSDLRKKTERALMPTKVRERLIVGNTGDVNITWLRDGQKIATKLTKAPSEMPGIGPEGDAIRLPLNGSTSKLKDLISGKPQLTLDLRHNVNGDFNAMRDVLSLLAPTGKYGVLATDKKETPLQLSITKGNPNPPKLTLLVDQTTAGSAEILALALSSKGLATVKGSRMSSDRSVKQVVQLPDGSGYTLVTANYQVSGATK